AMELAPHETLYDIALARDAATARASFEQHSYLSTAAFRDLVDLLHDTEGLGHVLRPTARTWKEGRA
ncbi:MAG: hypothetical protein AAGF22_03070, partial [Pseudomonadota bacterium]